MTPCSVLCFEHDYLLQPSHMQSGSFQNPLNWAAEASNCCHGALKWGCNLKLKYQTGADSRVCTLPVGRSWSGCCRRTRGATAAWTAAASSGGRRTTRRPSSCHSRCACPLACPPDQHWPSPRMHARNYSVLEGSLLRVCLPACASCMLLSSRHHALCKRSAASGQGLPDCLMCMHVHACAGMCGARVAANYHLDSGGGNSPDRGTYGGAWYSIL